MRAEREGNRIVHWVGLAAFSCFVLLGCMAQQADVVRVKRELDRKISELDKSKAALQQAVAEANQALDKANSIIAQQRTEIKTLLQARADLVDQMEMLKDGDLSEVRGAIDENHHQLQTHLKHVESLQQQIQRSEQAAKERDEAMRPMVQQIQERLTHQEEAVTTQAEKMTEFRASLVDFQQVLTTFRETMVQQDKQSQEARYRIDEISRKQLRDAQATTGNFEEVKHSIDSVVSALEQVSNTFAARLDEHEQKLAQVSHAARAPVPSSRSSRNRRSARTEEVTQSVKELRRELDNLSQTIQSQGNSDDRPLAMFSAQPRQERPATVNRLPRGTSNIATTAPTGGSPSPTAPSTHEMRDSAVLAYQQNFALLRAGDLHGAINGFGEFLRQYPDDRLASNAQYWLGECYYGQRRFTQAIQEFERVFTQYPTSKKVPAALLKIGYSNLELQKPDTARAVFRQLVRTFPKSPEAAKAYSKLTEVDGSAKHPS